MVNLGSKIESEENINNHLTSSIPTTSSYQFDALENQTSKIMQNTQSSIISQIMNNENGEFLDKSTVSVDHNQKNTPNITVPSQSRDKASSGSSKYVEMSVVTVQPPAKKQQKKRIPGSFVCDYEGCSKSFTRQEHLSRHKLNHNPTVIYKCKYPDCESTFVRSDLQERHHKRHENRILKEKKLKLLELKSQRNVLYNRIDTLNFNLKPTSSSSSSSSPSTSASSSTAAGRILKPQSTDNITVDASDQKVGIPDSSISAPRNGIKKKAKSVEHSIKKSHGLKGGKALTPDSEPPEMSVSKVFDNGASLTILDLSEKFISDSSLGIPTLEFKESTTNAISESNILSIKGDNIQSVVSPIDNTSIITNNNRNMQKKVSNSNSKAMTRGVLPGTSDSVKRTGSLFENKTNFKLQKSNGFIQEQRPSRNQEQRSNSYRDQISESFQDSSNTIISQVMNKSNSLYLENTNILNSIGKDSEKSNNNSNISLPISFNDNKTVPNDINHIVGNSRNHKQGQFNMSIQHLLSNASSPGDKLINDFSESSSPLEISAWIESNFMPSSFAANNNQQFSNDLLHFGLPFNMSKLFQYMSPFLDNSSDSQEFLISLNMIEKITAAIPSLANNIDLNVTSCQRCLQIYWKLFHVQFPFLHKPSFIAEQAPELLIISMIMLGAGLVSSTGCDESEYITNSRNLADSICIPLRWKLFEINDYSQPAETWMVQSLLILEYYEKFFTSRNLHERNHAHHGAIIQLLRKSSTLGAGSDTTTSYNSNNDDETIDEDRKRVIWQKWIDFECLKRATLMAFYIDSTHSIIFGHFGILYSHQIQIEMPCDDELWESTGSNFKVTMLKKPRLFLQELRSLLKNQAVRTGVFGKRILMSGLLAIIFQLQQRDLQTSALGWDKDKRDSSWKEYLSYILDYLAHDSMKGCCDTESAVLLKHDNEQVFEPSGKNSLKSYFSKNDTRCKYPAYHIAHIIMRISHHNLVIFSGDNMWSNKTATLGDYHAAKKKIGQWANSTSGRLSVIHAFLYLFEMFLTPQNYNYDVTNPDFRNYKYECLNDPIVERSYAIYIATLAVWAYCFTVEGPESNILANDESIDITMYSGVEDGYSFLRRIRNDLSRHTRSMLHTIPSSDASDFHKVTLFQANFLPFITNKKNVTGLLAVVSLSLSKSNWQLAREFSLLFRHCVRRSLGSQVVYCNRTTNATR